MQAFPVHEDLLEHLGPGTEPKDLRTWREISDLSEEEQADAIAVIGALNDVAQYVTDGLSLRSALQQYHTIFVRAGALLCPYLDRRNAPVEDTTGRMHRPARYGRRVVFLYNAGLAYHRRNEKHRGTEISIDRPAVGRKGRAHLMLVDSQGGGVAEHPGFGDEPSPRRWRLGDPLASVIRDAQRRLRR